MTTLFVARETAYGKIPGGRGKEPRQEDLHELQRKECDQGDSVQEVWVQGAPDQDKGDKEDLIFSHS